MVPGLWMVRLLCDYSVAVAWGLAGDEDADRVGASIQCLMLLAGGDFEAFSSFKKEVVVIHFEGELAFEHEEELARVYVGVAGFAGAGWHELFNDAEFGRF